MAVKLDKELKELRKAQEKWTKIFFVVNATEYLVNVVAV
jgi:hypothetical protein